MNNTQNHWDVVYSNAKTDKLGWYEEIPEPSLEFIDKCKLDKNAHILDVGSGVTTLISSLLKKNYINITAIDISEEAIKIAKKGIAPDLRDNINWIRDDITNPKKFNVYQKVDLWHDRTVLHFLTGEKDQEGYLTTLKKSVKKSGYVIIAVFALNGANKCSGLDVKRYDHEMIKKFLGNEFNLHDHFSYTYLQPSGNERPFIYTLFQRR